MSESMKEIYAFHKPIMVDNLVRDQTVYNIDHKDKINDFMGAYGYTLEEVEETEEALEQLKADLQEMWTYIRNNAEEELIISRMEVIIGSAKNVLLEALDVAAVMQKAVNQLKKAPITDQSK